MRIEIIRADPKHVDAIRSLTLRAYDKWVSITPRKPRPMTADYVTAIREHRFDLLYVDGRLVGLVETVPQDRELMIVNVAIEPGDQGKGYGSRLMRHAETIANNAGLAGTRLYTNKLMAENIRLYQALGYRWEKDTHHDLGTVAVHMVRSL